MEPVGGARFSEHGRLNLRVGSRLGRLRGQFCCDALSHHDGRYICRRRRNVGRDRRGSLLGFSQLRRQKIDQAGGVMGIAYVESTDGN